MRSMRKAIQRKEDRRKKKTSPLEISSYSRKRKATDHETPTGSPTLQLKQPPMCLDSEQPKKGKKKRSKRSEKRQEAVNQAAVSLSTSSVVHGSLYAIK